MLLAVKGLAACHLIKNGSGEFTVPELGVKLKRVDKPARPAGKREILSPERWSM